MQKYHLKAKTRRSFRRTTDSDQGSPIAKNWLGQDFSVGIANKTWGCDLTYVKVKGAWRYLATVHDIGTRKWIGYAIANHPRTELIVDALNMALHHEGQSPELLHTDRGCQYASANHRAVLRKHGIKLSMSRKGSCWDNAVVESFYAAFKLEVGAVFASDVDLKFSTFDYFNHYNRQRPHSALGNKTPSEYHQIMREFPLA